MTDDNIVTLPDGRQFTFDDYQRRLEALRRPFAPDELELKPQQVRKGDQNRAKCLATNRQQNVSADGAYCGGYHAWSIHLDYVGHAGIRDRLTEVDPGWSWEPVAKDQFGLPITHNGGMWGNLTVLGITKLGYGDAAGKDGHNAIKEMIGDFIRNAAMSFGVGTYLWSKSEAAAKKKLGDAEQALDETQAAAGQPEPQPETQSAPAAPDWDAELKRAWNDINLLRDLHAKARGMGAPPEYLNAVGSRGMQLEALQTENAQND